MVVKGTPEGRGNQEAKDSLVGREVPERKGIQ